MPLSGVKVLDLTRVLSGPFCTALLGDMGADIIKVEAPEGDSVRGQGAGRDGLSWYFAQFNRNKRSIKLDLRKPEAKAVLADPAVETGPDRQWLYDYLLHGLHDHKPQTAFAGIRALAAATWAVVDADGVHEQTYWTPTLSTDAPADTDGNGKDRWTRGHGRATLDPRGRAGAQLSERACGSGERRARRAAPCSGSSRSRTSGASWRPSRTRGRRAGP